MSPQGEIGVVLEKPKRAPRKRAPKADFNVDAAAAPIKRAPQKRTVRKADDEPTSSRVTARKAPTPIAANRAQVKRSRKNVTVVVVLLLLGIGSSAAVGFTDKGQIDVAQTIAQRNEAARAAGQPEITIPVQTTPEPNGGLTGVGDIPSNAPPVATSTAATASSTDATASSTEEAAPTETASTT